MSFPSSRRATRLTSGVLFLVLLGLVVYAPTPAWASCGDDVVPHHGRSAMDYLSDLDSPLPPSGGQAEQAPVAPSRDLPCSGPTCSRGPGVPYVPAPPPPLRCEPWCCTTSMPPLTGPELVDDLAGQTPRRPRRTSVAIEHPPRTPARCPS
jgi:hypothetical protein